MSIGLILLFIILPPITFAISNIMDKKLTTGGGSESKPATLMLVGSFFNIIISIIIFIIFRANLHISWPMFFNGALFSIAIWIYLTVLSKNDTEDVVIWYQTIPIFGFVGAAIFLREFLSLNAILGIILIIGGSCLMSYKKGHSSKNLIILMLISSALVAISDVIFAYFGREINLWSAIFSDISGKAFSSLFFVLIPGTAKGFVSALRNKLGWQAVSEITFSIGDFFFDLAKLYAPIVIVQSIASTQPAFVFVFVLILGIFFPKFIEQQKIKKNIYLKILSLVLVIIGTFVLFINA